MYTSHKKIIFSIFFSMLFLSYACSMKLSESVVQCLITFFSIAFGFYMTCIAIIYNTSYTKRLHSEEDSKILGRRKIHTLKYYFLFSGYWSIFSIVSIIAYSAVAHESAQGHLLLNVPAINFPYTLIQINLNLLVGKLIYSISAVNVYLIALFLNTILDGMVEESRK